MDDEQIESQETQEIQTQESDPPELEDMDLFSESESQEDNETPEESQETEPENYDEELSDENNDLPPVIEWDGNEYQVPELVQSAQFGAQAAQEVIQLREEVSILDEYAKLAGVDRRTYLSQARQQLEDLRVQQEAQRQNVTPETAKQLMEAKNLLERNQQASQAAQQRRARTAPFMELIRRYPELQNPSNMPPEVVNSIQHGAHPVIAYQDFMLHKKQAMEQVAQQKQTIQNKSPGSAAGVGAGSVDDELAAIFDAALYE